MKKKKLINLIENWVKRYEWVIYRRRNVQLINLGKQV